MTVRTQEISSAALDKLVSDALLTTYGYRRENQLRGEFVIENHQVVSNTLHEVVVWERDRSGQSSNPLNDWDEYEAQEAEIESPGEDPCASGWCGNSACYRCNPFGRGPQ